MIKITAFKIGLAKAGQPIYYQVFVRYWSLVPTEKFRRAGVLTFIISNSIWQQFRAGLAMNYTTAIITRSIAAMQYLPRQKTIH